MHFPSLLVTLLAAPLASAILITGQVNLYVFYLSLPLPNRFPQALPSSEIPDPDG